MGEQRIEPGDWEAAIADHDGRQLVVGGPGTGKTEFLVRRAVHLIETELATPDEILVLSFSRRGSADLRNRIEQSLSGAHPELDATTFHSFSFRLLEMYGTESLGWARTPTLLTSLEYVLRVRRSLGAEDPAEWPVLFQSLLTSSTFAEEVADFTLRCSELLIEPQHLGRFQREDWRALPSFMTRFRADMVSDHRIDYGTVQAMAVAALKNPETASALAARYRYVLVDEYQDTTAAQAQLLHELANGGANLTVAADPYQSIFSFRGADLENVAAFPEAFASADGHPASRRVLTTSFRAPAEILESAVALTEGRQLPGASGPVVPAPGTGSVEAYVFDQATREAEWIADEIQQMHADGLSYGSMAVFVRSKRRFLPGLSRALDRRGIPHARPDSRLSDHPAVRAVFDCVSAATSPEAEASRAIRRLLLGPLFRLPVGRLRAIERGRAGALQSWPEVLQSEVPAGAALAELLTHPAWAEEQAAVEGFWQLWNSLPQFVELVEDPGRAEERAAWSSLAQVLGRLSERDPKATLSDFVRWSEEEAFEAQPLLDFKQREVEQLTVTTLHQSKGLEFEVVFIADAVDGVFPDLRARESLIGTRHLSPHLPTDPTEYRQFRLQEETRLAYTAMTRARRRVIWTATSAGLDAGEGAPSPLLLRIGVPSAPQDEDRPPVTTAQAEAWLRRILADPAAPPPRRLAALHCLARGPQWDLRDPTVFAGIQIAGSDTGIALRPTPLSPSQATAYETCPRRYAIERRLRVSTEGSVYSAFGLLIHKVLELTEDEALQRGDSHGTAAEALAHLDALWDPAPFGYSPWAEAWRARAETTISFAYDHWPNPNARPLALEQDLAMELGGVEWRGIADRIEVEDEVIRVVDYKTSKRTTKAEAATSLQLGFYILATRTDPDLVAHGTPNAAQLWMVARHNVKSFSVFPFDIDNLSDVEERLHAVASGIAEEKWEPRPHEDCDRCPVQLVCPAWPQGSIAYSA